MDRRVGIVGKRFPGAGARSAPAAGALHVSAASVKMRFRDQMKVGADGQERLRLVNNEG